MKTVSTRTLCKQLGLSRNALLARAAQECWMYTQGPSRRWVIDSLPKEIQVRIQREKPAVVPGASSLKEASERSRAEATYRASLLSLFESLDLSADEFVESYNTGELSPAIFQKLGKVSLATFYRWMKAWKEAGASGLLPRWERPAGSRSSLTDLEKGYLEHWYLSPERRTARHCWILLKESLPESQATYAACLRYLKSLPKPLVDFHRLGKRKFEALYQPYIDRDPSLYQPMEQAVSDHHNFDFLVERDGSIFRPWITVFQDYRSSKILGFCPSAYPSSLSILVALYQMVVQYGAPDLLHIDNGKDYRSRILSGETRKVKTVNTEGIPEEELVYLQGSCALLGMEVTFCRPYHGQSKGRTERTFGTFCEYFSKNTGTYVGSNTVTRPEEAALFYRALNKQAKRTDLYRWDDFVLGLEAFIRWWNANWRGTGKGMEGRTPDEVFASGTRPRKPVDPEALALALTKPFVRTVRRNGVQVAGVQYWSQELLSYVGQEVLVRVPLANPDQAVVLDAKGKVICTAQANWFAETRDLAADNRRVSQARRANLELIQRYSSRTAPSPAIPFLPVLPESSNELPLAVGEDRRITRRGTKTPAAGTGRLVNPLDL